MAVQRETFKSGTLTVTGPHMPKVEEMTRHQSGDWCGLFRIAGEVLLPDGRTVEFYRKLRVRANCQVGRRPRRLLA